MLIALLVPRITNWKTARLKLIYAMNVASSAFHLDAAAHMVVVVLCIEPN
jgi:hypothetical protein